MDNRVWLSGAAASPPAAPASPSVGYPSPGDPLTATPATKGGAFWFHQLGEELRAIQAAAGITPDHTSLTQLLTALRSAGVFQTAAQFDTSTKAATMEALQRALGNCRGTRLLSGAATLGVDDLGKKIICGGSGGYTVNLPPVGSLPEGVTYPVWVNATNPVSFAANGAEVIYVGQSSTSVTPYSVSQGEQLEFTKYSGGWVISGAAQLKHAAGFSASLATSGWRKLPNGDIEQWGFTSSLAPSTNLVVTYPIAFPSAVYSVNATPNPVDTTTDGGAVVTGTGLTQFTTRWGRTVGAAATAQIHWRAIGK